MGEDGPQAEQKSSEQIVAEILANVKEITAEEADAIAETKNVILWSSQRHYLLEYGGKYLIISLKQEMINTYVKNNGKEKQPKETTLLYTAAKKVMQQLADETGKEFMYKLITPSFTMRQWAIETGSKIFDWTEESDYEQQAAIGQFWFSSKFSPQKDTAT